MGAAVGAVVSVADLCGLLAAVGEVFDATVYGLLLVGLGFVVQVGTAALVGAGAGFLWPPRLRLRRGWLYCVVALACVGVGSVSFVSRLHRRHSLPPPPKAATGEHADVLLVVIDTLRADTLYGPHRDFPYAPSLRALAKQSLVFTDAESAAGWTVPSVASLLTGISPVSLGAYRRDLPAWSDTLADRLRDVGYRTHAVVDNALLEPQSGFAAGFESYFQRSAMRFAHSLWGFRLLPAATRRQLRESWPTAYYGCDGVNAQALRWVDSDGPLFLYVHYMEPHAPYYPHAELGPPPQGAVPTDRTEVFAREQRFFGLSLGQLQFLRYRYQGEVRHVDACVGKLLAAWRQRGRPQLTVVTADHGEEMLEHGELGHGNSLYQELVHVPLMLSLPSGTLPLGQQSGAIDTPVSHLDVAPTLLDALHVPFAPAKQLLAGRSWLPWLRGDAGAPGRPLFAAQDSQGRRLTRFRLGRWVRIENLSGPRAGIRELYDKMVDYAELHDVAHAAPGELERLAQAAKAYQARQPLDQPRSLEGSQEALRALGYVQ